MTSSIRYNSLHPPSPTDIDPQCFAQFYEAWKLVLQDNDSVELPGLELEKEEEVTGRVQERVLAVSPLVRTNFGIQSQLVLTTFRYGSFIALGSGCGQLSA